MDYNFDDRLLWESITLNSDNFLGDRLCLNGIYYRYECSSSLKLGDQVIITGIKGNILLLEKDIQGEQDYEL